MGPFEIFIICAICGSDRRICIHAPGTSRTIEPGNGSGSHSFPREYIQATLPLAVSDPPRNCRNGSAGIDHARRKRRKHLPRPARSKPGYPRTGIPPSPTTAHFPGSMSRSSNGPNRVR